MTLKEVEYNRDFHHLSKVIINLERILLSCFMFHNFRSTTERLVTVLMLLVALIACEQAPESNSNSENQSLIPIESELTVVSLQIKQQVIRILRNNT